MAQNDFETTPVVTEVENFETAVSRGDRNGGVGETVIPTKLYVKRIPESVTSKELNDLFAAYGSVTECAIIRSYAFIHFSKPDEAARALEGLNGFRFMGINLEIEHSKSQSRGRRSNRRDVYRKDESWGGRRDRNRDRERDRSPVYTGYGGYHDYNPGYGGYSENYGGGGGYMGHYRPPTPRRGYHQPPGPRYMAPPPPQYNNYVPIQNYPQQYAPARPRAPPPPVSYYPS
eukprot:TRINITY_DN4767_c0_g2_i5.p2 TRINITY_DN4767_c0_g2~~TRINITY_DN4767_c0_g2_i5.p2  ORF type:complete len:231 (-),score=36.84 TRINITY_DN4767_c0_g2_i5:851-1543(-)